MIDQYSRHHRPWLLSLTLIGGSVAACNGAVATRDGTESAVAGESAMGEAGASPSSGSGGTDTMGPDALANAGAGSPGTEPDPSLVGPAISQPATTHFEPCIDSGLEPDPVMTTVQGSLDGAEIDHGYCRAATTFIEPSSDVVGLDGTFGGEGYLFFLAPKTDGHIAQVNQGLLRMPKALDEAGDWYCIDSAVAEASISQVVRVRIDGLSRLGSVQTAEPGRDSYTGTVEANVAGSPLDRYGDRPDGSYGNIYDYGIVGVGSGPWIGPYELPEMGGWRLLAFPAYLPDQEPEPEAPRRDLLLVEGGEDTPLRVAFPAAGSTATREDDLLKVELLNVSEPMGCPGEPVAGELTIISRLSYR